MLCVLHADHPADRWSRLGRRSVRSAGPPAANAAQAGPVAIEGARDTPCRQSSVTVRGTTDEGDGAWVGHGAPAGSPPTAAYGGGGSRGIGALGASATACSRPRPGWPAASSASPFERRPRRRRRLRRRRRRARSSSLVLGDSTAAGLGADAPLADPRRDHRHRRLGPDRPPGAPHQRRRRRRRVRATWASSWPTRSTRCPRPDVAMIMIGANDVTHRIDKADRRAPPRGRPSGGCATPAPRSSSAPAPTSARIQPVAQPLRLLGAALEPRPGRRPDRRGRRGRRPHGVARRPARPGVRRSGRTRCSAPTASTRRPPATRGPPPPCCPASAPRSACGPASGAERRPTAPRRGRRPGRRAAVAPSATPAPR